MTAIQDESVTGPLVSVIVPSYNSARTLERTLESVFTQSYRNIEVVLVDDGSTDGSVILAREIADRDNRLKLVAQENKGPGPARNHGLKQSKGKYIAFLDADDYWDRECLLKLVDAAEEGGADITYCGWQNIGVAIGKGEPFIPPDYENVDKYETFLGGCRWPIHAALTRRSAIDDVGGFDEQWTSCMDYDLWLRMATTHSIERVPEVLAYYVHHAGEQITKNRLRGAVNHWRIQRRYINEHPEVARKLGRNRIRKITYGELLRRAYICYWDRDLDTAHKLFRIIMKGGYGKVSDWKYLAPALLPMRWYRGLINRVDNAADDKR
jgi:glycosyltransferase involved in cell wall biosynthesis